MTDHSTALDRRVSSLFCSLPAAHVLCALATMVTKRSPSTSTARDVAGDALDDLLAEFADSSVSPPSTAPPPIPSVRRPRFSATSAAAPASTPSSAMSNVSGGVKGHLKGKETLLLTVSSELIDSMCRGYVGGPRGARERFCRNLVSSPDQFCCQSHAGEKFDVRLLEFYIKMSAMSALCEPSLSLVDAEEMNVADSLRVKEFGSREWLVYLTEIKRRLQALRDEKQMEDAMSDISDTPRTANQEVEDLTGMFNFNLDEDEPSVGEVKEEGVDQEPKVKTEHVFEKVYETLQDPLLLYESDDSLSSEKGGWRRATRTTRDTIGTLHASLNSVIRALPMGLDMLDKKMEASLAHFDKAFQDLKDAKELHQDDMFGTIPPKHFIDDNRSLANAIVVLQSSLESLQRQRDTASEEFYDLANRVGFLETGLQSAQLNLKGVVIKMADVVRAAVTKASSQHKILSNRIDKLSRNSSDLRSVATASSSGSDSQDPVDLFTSLLQGSGFGGAASSSNLAAPGPSNTGQPLILGHSSSGAPITADDLLSAYLAQAEALSECQKKMKEMEMSIASKGVKVGDFGFESESELVDLIIKEKVNADAFGTAVDAVSIFCHFKDGHATTQENTAEMKNMRAAGISDAVCLRYVASFRQVHPSYFLNASNTPVSEGQRFPMLENKTVWEGHAPIRGRREKFIKAVQEAYKTGTKYIDQSITTNGVIRKLCHHMMKTTADWLTELVAHVSAELLSVSQYGIPEKETFTLVSDEIQMIYESLWAKRMCMQEFSADRDPTLYYARALWITMEAHMIMEEFLVPGFAVHVTITSFFVRFLAQQTGMNFSAGLTGTISKLETKIDTENKANAKRFAGITKRLDNHTNNIRALCTKTGQRFTPMKEEGGSDS